MLVAAKLGGKPVIYVIANFLRAKMTEISERSFLQNIVKLYE